VRARQRLQLDEVGVGVDEIGAEPVAVREASGDVDDVRVEMRRVGCTRGEHRDAP
jgi:hypothetical protein